MAIDRELVRDVAHRWKGMRLARSFPDYHLREDIVEEILEVVEALPRGSGIHQNCTERAELQRIEKSWKDEVESLDEHISRLNGQLSDLKKKTTHLECIIGELEAERDMFRNAGSTHD